MYRFLQFCRALTARIRPEELEDIATLLGPTGMALFRKLSRMDQRHALDVYSTLCSRGYDEPDLLVAALLHDIGKTEGTLPLAYRVAVAVLEEFSPGLLNYLEANHEHGLFKPFRVAHEHPEIGARLVAEAGFSEATVDLVLRHHGAPQAHDVSGELGGLLEALQKADSVS